MRIDKLWLYFLPILFLPNLGFFEGKTAVGELKMSDILMLPYLLLLAIDILQQKKEQYITQLKPYFLFFLFIIYLSSLLIYVFYDYQTTHQMVFSLVKCAKFTLYGLAGYWTVKAIQTPEKTSLFYTMVLWSAAMAGFSMYFIQDVASTTDDFGGIENNATSCVLSILLLLTVVNLQLQTSKTYKLLAILLLPLAFIGFFISEGRGAWIAFALGLGLFFYKTGLSKMAIQLTVISILGFSAVYVNFPRFSEDIDKLFLLDEKYKKAMESYGVNTSTGVEDGARLETWIHEGPKFINAPLLGTGFFHRGKLSGLWATGSHNFWLQMLLETGLLGFFTLIYLFKKIYMTTTLLKITYKKEYYITLTGILVAFFNGMGGEYFYGGLPLFSFFLLLVPLFSIIAKKTYE
jgi:O-antigen ligase